MRGFAEGGLELRKVASPALLLSLCGVQEGSRLLVVRAYLVLVLVVKKKKEA